MYYEKFKEGVVYKLIDLTEYEGGAIASPELCRCTLRLAVSELAWLTEVQSYVYIDDAERVFTYACNVLNCRAPLSMQ
jgi:hypothetical protein